MIINAFNCIHMNADLLKAKAKAKVAAPAAYGLPCCKQSTQMQFARASLSAASILYCSTCIFPIISISYPGQPFAEGAQ